VNTFSSRSHVRHAASRPVPAVQTRGRIVVVDDEPAILETWGLILTMSGYDVVCCTDPQVALEVIARGCDCVITDYHMPQMTGVELLRAARTKSRAKFILMTANGSEAIARDALAAGAWCIVHKPTPPPIVLQKLEKLAG
jgi:CheY-like chemotaxis protein